MGGLVIRTARGWQSPGRANGQFNSKGLGRTEMLVVLVLTPLAVHSGLTCALFIESHRAGILSIIQQRSEYSSKCLTISKGLTRLI